MGCFGSKEISEARYTSIEIDRQIYQEKAAFRYLHHTAFWNTNVIKMLLLGAGESGKSTIVKQMKLIHEGCLLYKFSDRILVLIITSYQLLEPLIAKERDSYKEIIYSNVIESMQAILSAMKLAQIDFQDYYLADAAGIIESLPTSMIDCRLDPQAVTSIRRLWHDPGVKTCFNRSRDFQLRFFPIGPPVTHILNHLPRYFEFRFNDSTAYYLDSIDRIGRPDFQPDDQDILRSRVKTRGISETNFAVGEMQYRLLDVGGQRSERKKWIHCFENVTVIVFLAALSEYDQVLREDDSVNRMEEALNLFDSVCNSRWFSKTSMILFLNKIDIFKQKVVHSPVQNFFPEFATPHSNAEIWKPSADFFRKKFLDLNHSPSKQAAKTYIFLSRQGVRSFDVRNRYIADSACPCERS
ncbi:guanine nucleotide-binding protein subunit alpha [Puccinia sorghi]|uniref:Guanine nucleotide-binding protein subunit alpha n=1 Tax=Puccinia sorghi TaxID=27349 RepID=A0A0L6V793_9BASI|nr:guanine nucleotide-binding protein subunit alpha [Puccinia sorghi]